MSNDLQCTDVRVKFRQLCISIKVQEGEALYACRRELSSKGRSGWTRNIQLTPKIKDSVQKEPEN